MANTFSSFMKRHAKVITITFSVVLLTVSLNSFWLSNNIFNAEKFSNNLTSVFEQEDVRWAIGNSVAGQIYADKPIAGQILTEPTTSIVSSLLSTSQFQQIFSNLAEQFNQLIVQGEAQEIAINLSSAVNTVQGVLDTIAPDRETVVEAEQLEAVIVETGELPDLSGVGRTVLLLGPYTLIALIVIFIVAWQKVSTKRELAKQTGMVFLITSAVVYLMLWTELALLTSQISSVNATTVVRAIFDSFTSSLLAINTVFLFLGLGLIYAPKAYDWIKIKADKS